MTRRLYLDHTRTVAFTMPACPDCGGHDLRIERAERDAHGTLRWCRCRACGGKFNAMGVYSSAVIRSAETAGDDRCKKRP